ncbi:hypothetical protein [Abyssalbus ytuae]|uniref:Uncharacterized protein n=1 Tax=Abyssalbus ytuae TaxID=2926907 RepID=A0A9E7CTM1_9FLAO|nr:hypothetical protein [Abyssalbus ytuae]UOB16422.1 hypothetical protein MQE35_11815 [Abyssalbus ytuae]
MSKKTETGHAKNVANFAKLVSFCTGYGADYNPSNISITLKALTILYADAQNTVNDLNTALPAYNNAIAAREIAFKPLSKLITRVINGLKATGASPEVKDKAITIARKIQGRKTSIKPTEEKKQKMSEQGKDAKKSSSSRLSFDNRIDNFEKLINILSSIPQYNPNETELQVMSLTKLFEDLRAKNSNATATEIPLSNARLKRNNLLYTSEEGLIDRALKVKAYVKSLYGASSPQYRQISGLEFKRYKI